MIGVTVEQALDKVCMYVSVIGSVNYGRYKAISYCNRISILRKLPRPLKFEYECICILWFDGNKIDADKSYLISTKADVIKAAKELYKYISDSGYEDKYQYDCHIKMKEILDLKI